MDDEKIIELFDLPSPIYYGFFAKNYKKEKILQF